MKKYIYVCIIIIISFIFAIISCQLSSVSISERISDFVSDLNKSSGRNLYENFHTNMTNRNLWQDDTAFDATEFSKNFISFSITLTGSAQDLGGGVMYQAGTLTSISVNSPTPIKFNFKEENPDVWYILAIDIPAVAETWGTFTNP